MTAAEFSERILPGDLRELWPALSDEERADAFRLLSAAEQEEFFHSLSALDQASIVLQMQTGERRLWMRALPPDDAADLIQSVAPEERAGLLDLLDEANRREVRALLAYQEDHAGGLMNPRFARVRPEMTVDEAISYLRRQTQNQIETVYYVYALDGAQRLVGVVSFRELFMARGDKRVSDVMRTNVLSVVDTLDQEEVALVFAESDLIALPVVDAEGRMRGIVTADDVVDVVQEEATEDMQKIGGMAALDAPYLETGFWSMLRKRAGWLAVLFVGEMLTTSAMGYYEHQIARVVVLALFVPLIISSGGNSGSQASTLVIRAMALGEVRMRDWSRVLRRELLAGLCLGSILAIIGMIRVIIWEHSFASYGENYLLIGATVSLSLLGVVVCGTLSGSMLPFILRLARLDPASASAPFVATLVDVAGVLIYFSLAASILHSALH